MAEDSKKDSKVFDVAKPSDAKKDIGSKPMIIGHKSLTEDPMVKESKEETTAPEEEKQEDKSTPPSVSKKVITPPSEQKQEETPPNKEEATLTDETAQEEKKDSTEEEPAVDPEVEKNERNEKLQKMVDSKKYFVTVHESSHSHTRTFVLTFIIALLVGVVGVALLIDAEVIDLGVSLPFDFL